MSTEQGRAGARMTVPARLQVLLVEDDDGDALLVKELLADVGEQVSLLRAVSLREAEALWHPAIDCVVLDLALPDALGLDALVRMQQRGAVAVVVLTGLTDESQGVAAVAAGAQDYLLKGQIDGHSLHRAMRYAVQRHRADQIGRELVQSQLLVAENTRLSRGLLPAPLLSDPAIGYAAHYAPGGGRMLLGGDFYDVVQTGDDAVWVLIGDVCGHGPDEAALGVALRIGWRTLVLAGHPDADILPTLQRLLIHERLQPYLFVTAAMIRIEPDRAHATMWLAGHPAPIVRTGAEPWREQDSVAELPLGVDAEHVWTAQRAHLGTSTWQLLLYTDGLVEGRAGDGEQLWVDGLLAMVGTGADPDAVVRTLIAAVRQRVPGHSDDVAVLMLTHDPGPRP